VDIVTGRAYGVITDPSNTSSQPTLSSGGSMAPGPDRNGRRPVAIQGGDCTCHRCPVGTHCDWVR
jgi:hypothetical protein